MDVEKSWKDPETIFVLTPDADLGFLRGDFLLNFEKNFDQTFQLDNGSNNHNFCIL